MRKYRVTYDISTHPNPSPTAAFQTMSTHSDLVMEVLAAYPDQARLIVQNMLRGLVQCRIKGDYNVRARCTLSSTRASHAACLCLCHPETGISQPCSPVPVGQRMHSGNDLEPAVSLACRLPYADHSGV